MEERTFRDLPAWQKAFDFAHAIADLRDAWPEEAYPDLIDQMWNDALTVPTKIASGSLPLLDPDWPGGGELAQNLSVALMALRHVDTRIEIGHNLGCLDEATRDRFLALADEVRHMIDELIEQARPMLEVDRFHPPFSEN
jgi:four helix bundle protein